MSLLLSAVWCAAHVAFSVSPGEQADELVLEGVIVARNPAHSVALLRRVGAERARAIRVGQSYGGRILVEVTTDFARLQTDDGSFELAWSDRGSAYRASTRARAEMAVTSEPEWERRRYSRATDGVRLEKEIPVILSDTELTPRVEAGEIRGLELLRIPDGTLLSEAGLRPGDVLRSLNGQPLSGLESLWELLARFDGKSELRLIVERRGEVVRLAYALDN